MLFNYTAYLFREVHFNDNIHNQSTILGVFPTETTTKKAVFFINNCFSED